MCKGIYYQYRDKSFINEKGKIIQRRSLVFRKRISCKGCLECQNIKENLKEDILCENFNLSEYKLLEGSTYKIEIISDEDSFSFLFIETDRKGNVKIDCNSCIYKNKSMNYCIVKNMKISSKEIYDNCLNFQYKFEV